MMAHRGNRHCVKLIEVIFVTYKDCKTLKSRVAYLFVYVCLLFMLCAG